MREEPASIGKSIVINGELNGSEDLTIEGRVDGKIELRNHVLTIGSNGQITAQVAAKSIIVLGQVTGNLTATEKVDIQQSGSVEGDIVAPRVAIADGSHFRGGIDMQRKEPPLSTDGTVASPEPEARASMPEAASVTGELLRISAIRRSRCRQPPDRGSARSGRGSSGTSASSGSTPRRQVICPIATGPSFCAAARPSKTSRGSCTRTSRGHSGTRASGGRRDSTDNRSGASIQ